MIPEKLQSFFSINGKFNLEIINGYGQFKAPSIEQSLKDIDSVMPPVLIDFSVHFGKEYALAIYDYLADKRTQTIVHNKMSIAYHPHKHSRAAHHFASL